MIRSNNSTRTLLMSLAVIGAASRLSCLATHGDEASTDSKAPKIVVSKETTFLTDPLRADGTVDYTAALNARNSRGVTPDNNAIVSIWKAIGISEIPASARDEYFQLLGIAALPVDGEYFVSLDTFIKRRKPRWDDDALAEFYDRVDAMHDGPWRAKQYPLVAEWIESNQRPLELLAEAARRDRFYSPAVRLVDRVNSDAAFPALASGLREVVRLLAQRAMLKLGEGHAVAAWRDLETCFQLAKHLTDGGSLSFALVGSATANIAANATITLVQYPGSDALDLPRVQQRLQDTSSLTVISETTEYNERCAYLDFIVSRSRSERGEQKDAGLLNLEMFNICFGNDFDIDWNTVLRMANAHFDTMLELVRIDDPLERAKRTEEFSEQLGSLNGRLPRKNDLQGLALLGDLEDPEGFRKLLDDAKSPQARGELVATALSSFFVSAWPSLRQADERLTERCRMAEIAVALAAYRLDEAEYPRDLSRLVPAHLAAMPRSAHTGKEFQYTPAGNGYVLSSVGSGELAGTFNDLTIVDRRERKKVISTLEARGVLLEKSLGEVRHADLSFADFDDDDLARLAILAEIDSLSLRGTQVTDRGVAKLKTFNRLWSLDLSDTQVTDEGLKSLRSMSKLTFLRISGTEVSDKAVQQLQQALPKCQIDR